MPARETAARFPLPHGECGGWCGGGSAPYPRLVFGVAARPPFFSKKGEEGWGTGAATGRGNAPGKEGCDPTRSTPKRAEGSPQEHTSLRSCEACVNIRHCYDYLIHDTDSCRKQGKEQYDPSRRITGNNFDIGAYEQISSAQKQEMLKELVGYIIANGFTTINDFTVAAMNDFDGCYWEIIVGYNGTLERYCRGNYLKRKAKAETRDADE